VRELFYSRRRSNHPGNSQAPETSKVDNLERDDINHPPKG
jgi:hypothetical protein